MFLLGIISYVAIGVIGGLFGLFYRNCLKEESMIFYSIYKKILEPMAESNNKILSFIAYPLGYCIYCASTWIAWFIYLIAWWEFGVPLTIVGFITVAAIQHLTVLLSCKYILSDHPDF